MIYAFCVIGGLILGGIISWLIATNRNRGHFNARLNEAKQRASDAETKAAGAEGTITELRREIKNASDDFETLRSKLEEEQQAKVKAETQLTESTKWIEEEKKFLEEAKSRLTETFKAIAGDTLDNSTKSFFNLAKETFDKVLVDTKGDLGKRQEAIQGLVKPLSESLKQYEEHVRGIEKERIGAYTSLTEQLKVLSKNEQDLRKETGDLANALKTPKVVGSWGQIALERVMELTGMSEHCDFSKEVSVTTEEGRLRPDAIVHLPGDRDVVVDAKATFGAYHEAVAAKSEDQRNSALTRHANQVRSHMTNLASKDYSKQFAKAPEFVVMFIPGESFFAAAIHVDGNLLEDSLEKGIVLATPTTLFALLRAVAYGWRQEQIAKNAREISDLGKQLYERMGKLAEYLANIGKGLDKANDAYNSAVGSIEVRVLPAARKFKDLGAATGAEIPALQPTEKTMRMITAPELTEDVG